MRPRTALPALAFLGVLALLTVSCGGSPRGTDWYFGNALVVRVTAVQRTEEVRFTEGEVHFVIRPSQENTQLAAVKMEIRSREANIVFLSIGQESVSLRDQDDVSYQPIDFRERREVVEVKDEEEERYRKEKREDAFAPFLWGDVELPRKCGEPLLDCQLVGWVLFEVPKGIEAKLVLWEAADTIYVRF